MKILGLVDSIDHVCCRYRLQAFVHGLAQAGHHLELQALGRGFTRWRTLGRVHDADAVILQRKLLAPWELSRLRRHARRLIFDFDDAVFLRDSYHPRGQISNQRRRRFTAAVAAADVVVAGNNWLASQSTGARNVVEIPTCIDPSSYRIAEHANAPSLTCVWIGSSSTLNGLEKHRVLLEQVGCAVPDLTLRLVCDRAITLKNWNVEHWPWSAATEAEAMAAADVGISVLPDDDWSRGKCGLKVLQYLAAGLPVVGNPVGVTAALAGEAGMIVETPKQWVAALRQLRDVPLRRKMGALGRKRVEEHFSIRFGLQLWQNVLNDLAATRRAG